jgi:uncharacterized damage-inducible protein DinB
VTYYGARDLARSFRTVHGNTLTTAQEIPEEQYGFRPTPDSQSVGEILAHLAVQLKASCETHAEQRLKTFVGLDFLALVRARHEQARQLTGKAKILEALQREGEAFASYLDGVSEQELADEVTFPEPAQPRSKTRFEMLLSVKEHEMHHRAQLMVIQRLLGIVPHLTRERQARFATAGTPQAPQR